MNWKGYGRKWLWPTRGTIPKFLGGSEEHHENSQSGQPADIRTERLSNTSAERYRLTKLLGDELAEVIINILLLLISLFVSAGAIIAFTSLSTAEDYIPVYE
jgi:hypothetical protein